MEDGAGLNIIKYTLGIALLHLVHDLYENFKTWNPNLKAHGKYDMQIQNHKFHFINSIYCEELSLIHT